MENNIIIRWVVTVVEHNRLSNGKAIVLGTFKSEADAKQYVKNDIDGWYSKNCSEGVEVNYEKMNAHFDYNTNDKCEWQIHEVQIEL